jgi:alkylhydroperoxidase family enzyme
MPRLAYQDPAKLSPESRALLGEKPMNVARMLAVASEPVFQSVLGVLMAFLNGSSLSPEQREIAILRVGYRSGAAYELHQHEALSRHFGMTDAQFAAIRAGDKAALGDVGGAILALTDELIDNVRASDAAMAAIKQRLSERQIADLILLIGTYIMACRFLETTGVEIEDEPIDISWRPATN